MIPVALVTGFLGSGKTTFLQNVVTRHRDRQLVYLVNEFSTVDIDGQALELPPDQLVTIPGGSIFCRCLVTEFIGHLQAIADRADDAADGVVIEASGVADPKVIQNMLAETRLDRRFQLATIVTVIDPDTFGDLLETLPNIRAQVEAADIAIINKVDQHDETALQATQCAVREINPATRIERATYCNVDVDLFDAASPREMTGEYALCADPNYGRMTVTPADDIDLPQLAAALEPLKSVAYRMKGFVRCNGRVHHLDVSRSGVVLRPTSQVDAPIELVCIYPPDAHESIRTILQQIESGALGSKYAT